MLIVGLDWGRDAHRYVLLQEGNKRIDAGLLPNKTWAFEAWSKNVESHGPQVRLVLEGGNGLSSPLEEFVSSRGWEVVTITASAVKSYREHVLGEINKTDETDAHAIALLGASSGARSQTRLQPRRGLRRATRDRETLSRDKLRTINRLRSALAEIWPEFTSDAVPDLDKPSLLHLLSSHPDPIEWASLGVPGILQLLKSAKIRTRREFIAKLVHLAEQFQDVFSARDKRLRLMEIRLLARRLRNCCEDLADADEFVEAMAAEDPQVQLVDSIAGAGAVTAAGIVAEIQDVRNFSSEAKLASYSGLGLRRHQTGKSANYWLPQLRSNRRLKRLLLQLALQNSKFEPRSEAYIQKKLREGKKPLQARRALARQLVRVIYAMLIHAEPYRTVAS